LVEEERYYNMSKILFTILLLSFAFFGLGLNQVSASNAISNSTTVNVEAGSSWQVTVTQDYGDQIVSSLTFPGPYLHYVDKHTFAAKIENVRMYRENINASFIVQRFNGTVWYADLVKPDKVGKVTIKYEIPTFTLGNFIDSPLFWNFEDTKSALFIWNQGRDSTDLVHYGCGIVKGEALAHDFCSKSGELNKIFRMSNNTPLKGVNVFQVVLGFDFENDTLVSPPEGTVPVVAETVNQAINTRRFGLYSNLWGIPLSLLVAWTALAINKRQNAKISGPITAQYEPPNDLPVLLGSFLYDGTLNEKHLHAILMESILNGNIITIPNEDRNNVKLRWKLKSSTHFSDPWDVDDYALNAIFKNREYIEQRSFFDIDSSASTVTSLKGRIEAELVKRGLIHKKFTHTPITVANFIIGSLLAAGFFPDYFSVESILLMSSSAVLMLLCLQTLPKYTAKGREFRRLLEGYKHFIDTVESGRLKKSEINHMAERNDKEIVSYAIAFGINVNNTKEFKRYLPTQSHVLLSFLGENI
jgi:hypothetical protein